MKREKRSGERGIFGGNDYLGADRGGIDRPARLGSRGNGHSRGSRRRGRRRLETLEIRQLLTADPWQNPLDHYDVSNDGVVTPLDALEVIAALNKGITNLPGAGGSSSVATPAGSTTAGADASQISPVSIGFVDVAGTGILTPLDALDVIAKLQAEADPTISISDAPVVVEPTAGTTGTATFTVTLASASATPVTVDYETEDGTAVNGVDYTGTSTGTVTFPAGVTSEPITVPILHDANFTTASTPSGQKTFSVQLIAPSGSGDTFPSGADVATGTIELPTFTISSPQYPVQEPAAGTTGVAQFTVTLDNGVAFNSPLSVGYSTADGSAVSNVTSPTNGDYDAESGQITFPAGQTQETIQVPILYDAAFVQAFEASATNPSELYFSVKLAPIGNETISSGAGTGTISLATLSVSLTASLTAASGTALANSATPSTFEVGADTFQMTQGAAVATGNIAVDYSKTDTAAEVALEIQQAIDSAAIGVTALVNGSVVDLSSADEFDTAATGALTMVSNQTVTVAGQEEAQFTVTVAGTPPNGGISFDYATADGTATTANGNYTAVSVDKTGYSTVGSFYVDVPIFPATLASPGKFYLNLTQPAAGYGGAVITTTQASYTIQPTVETPVAQVTTEIYDTATPSVQIAPNSLKIGDEFYLVEDVKDIRNVTDGGLAAFYENVAYNSSLVSIVSAPDFSQSPFTSDQSGSTATAGLISDVGGAQLLSNGTTPGSGSQELFRIEMKVNAAGLLVFTNSPATPLNNPSYSVVEYNNPNNPIPVAPQPATVVAGGDNQYGEVNFDGAETIAGANSITVAVSPDPVTAPNATGGATVYADFTVTRSNPDATSQTFSYTTVDGVGPNGAVAGTDYTAISGTYTFPAPTPAGNSAPQTYTFQVPILPDLYDELDKTFSFTLSGNSNIQSGTVTETIQTSAPPPEIVVSAESALEGSPFVGSNNILVSLVNPTTGLPYQSDIQITVDYATVDATALAGVNYTATSGTLTFAPGVSSQSLESPVQTLYNSSMTKDTTFKLVLSNATYTKNTSASATETIDFLSRVGTDVAVALEAVDSNGNFITGPIELGSTFYLEALVQDTTSIPSGVKSNYSNVSFDSSLASIANNTAIDYGPSFTNDQLGTIAAGEITDIGAATATAPSNPDAEEILWSVPVTASGVGTAVFTGSLNPTPGTYLYSSASPETVNTVSYSPAAVTITEPSVTINNVTVDEPSAGTTGSATFTIALSGPTAKSVTVGYATSDGSALAGTDYSSTSGQFTFVAGGGLTQTVTVPILPDSGITSPRDFFVTLTGATNATISVGQGIGTIRPITVSVSTSTPIITENGGVQSAKLAVTIAGGQVDAVTVNYTTANGTAIAGANYTAESGSLTFQPGGAATQYVTVPILQTKLSAPVTFYFNLTSASGAKIVTGQASITLDPPVITPIAKVSTVLTDLNGNPLTSANLPVGTQFLLETEVEDLRGVSDGGLVAAYENIAYTSSVAKVDGSITYGPDFLNVGANGQPDSYDSGVFSTGAITDVGGVQQNFGFGATPPGSGVEQLLFTVPMIVTAAGTLTFTNAPATASGSTYDLLEYNNPSNPVIVTPPPAKVTAGGSNQYGQVQFVGTSIATGQDSMTIAGPATVIAPTSGTKTITYTVTRGNPNPLLTQTIDYTIEPGTGVPGDDYTFTPPATGYSGTLTFAPGVLTQTITVTVLADPYYEVNKTLSVVLSNAKYGAIATSTVNTTIETSLAEPKITASITKVNEGSTEVVTVSLSAASDETTTVNYSTSNGTATAGLNYVAITPGTLTFTPGETTKTLTVQTLYSSAMTANETYDFNLSGATNATIPLAATPGTIIYVPRTSTGTLVTLETVNAAGTPISSITVGGTYYLEAVVQDVSTPPSGVEASYSNVAYTASVASIAPSAQITYGAPGSTTSLFPNSQSGDLTTPGQITDIGATAAKEPANPGASQILWSVPVVAKAAGTATFAGSLDPSAKSYLFGSTGAETAAQVSYNTVAINAVEPSLTIDNVATPEPNANATGTATFTVSLSGPISEAVTVGYSTQDNSALAGRDYVAASGTLKFVPGGPTTQTIPVTILYNPSFGGSEVFFVNLSSPLNATLAHPQGICTIAPVLSVSSPTVIEDGGAQDASFVVTLSGAPASTVTVHYATAPGTALAGTNYTTTDGTLTFTPGGPTSQTVLVPIIETKLTGPLTFSLNLSGASNASIGVGQGIATLKPGSSATLADLSLKVTDLSGNPLTRLAVGEKFLLQGDAEDLRDTSLGGIITAYENIVFDSSLAAVDGAIVWGPDFSPSVYDAGTVGTGSITNIGGAQPDFGYGVTPPGGNVNQVLFTVPMVVTGDGVLTFSNSPTTGGVSYSINEYNSTVNPIPVAPAPTTVVAGGANVYGNVEFDGLSVAAGQNALSISGPTTIDNVTSGTTSVTYTVTRLVPDNSTITVHYATQNGTATAGVDYKAASGTLTFAPGATSQTVTVTIIGNPLNDADKTYSVVLSDPSADATIVTSTATTTIHSTAAPPSIKVSSSSISEGQSATITVSLVGANGKSLASDKTITVNYATANGTAIAGVNYVAASGTLTFAPGQTSKTITVSTDYTETQAANLKYSLTLSKVSNATIAAVSTPQTIVYVPPASISGYVYVDANDDGIKESSEVGIAGVTITLTETKGGSLTETTTTDSNGHYLFNFLQPGTYNIVESQPGFYVPGKNTPGTPPPTGKTVGDQFTGIVLAKSVEAVNYDYGELGVRSQFLSTFLNRRALLASSIETGEYGPGVSGSQTLNLQDGPAYVAFDGTWSGLQSVEALYNSAQGSVTLTLYNYNLAVLATSAAGANPALLTYDGVSGQTYILEISGTNPAVNLEIAAGLTSSSSGVSSSSSGSTASAPSIGPGSSVSSNLNQTSLFAAESADASVSKSAAATATTTTAAPAVATSSAAAKTTGGAVATDAVFSETDLWLNGFDA